MKRKPADLILRSLRSKRLEGWPEATAVQAAILRDAPSALLRMRFVGDIDVMRISETL